MNSSTEPPHLMRRFRVLRRIDRRACNPAEQSDAKRLAQGYKDRNDLIEVPTFTFLDQIVHSQPKFQVMEALDLNGDGNVLAAISRNDVDVVACLKQLVRKRSGRESAQRLRGDEAQYFLDLTNSVSDRTTERWAESVISNPHRCCTLETYRVPEFLPKQNLSQRRNLAESSDGGYTAL